jgi:futalosine hydrolase
LDGLTCQELRAAASGCEVVLLVATDAEAALLARALSDTAVYLVATKRLLVGRLPPLGAFDSAGGQPRSVETAAGIARAAGRRVALAVSGLDKVNAAHLLTCLLQAMDPGPRLVVQVGIAGALPGKGDLVAASVGDVVIATQEVYSDTGSSSPAGWLSARELGWPIGLIDGVESGGVFPGDGRLVAGALEAIAAADVWADQTAAAAIGAQEHPRVLAGPCVTASLVTGLDSEAQELADRWGAVAESMEGAAAAHICALYGTPFLEVRGISNLAGDRDRAAWQVQRAVAAASSVARAIVDALDGLPLEETRPPDPGEV